MALPLIPLIVGIGGAAAGAYTTWRLTRSAAADDVEQGIIYNIDATQDLRQTQAWTFYGDVSGGTFTGAQEQRPEQGISPQALQSVERQTGAVTAENTQTLLFVAAGLGAAYLLLDGKKGRR